MIDDFLTSPDELPPVRLRPEAAPRASAQTPAPVPGAPRTAIAAGVMLAVSVLGATTAIAAPLSRSTPAAEGTR